MSCLNKKWLAIACGKISIFHLPNIHNTIPTYLISKLSLKKPLGTTSIRNFIKMASNQNVDQSCLCTVDKFYEVVLKIVKNAGQLINTRISQEKSIVTKATPIDFVTETDQEVEKILIENISKNFPDHKFIGEEGVSSGQACNLTDAPTWIIDPIDGTMNFVHSFPHSCISIACFINKKPEIGIIYNPMLNQLFTAQKGKGAYFNGQKIHVSNKKKLSESLICVEFGASSRDPDKMKVVFENQQKLVAKVHGLRALGACALNMSMVAMGGADAYFEYGMHIWDIAAGELIVKEAGGVVMDPAGGEIDRMSRRMLCASSRELAEELVKDLVQYYPSPRD